MELGPEDVSLLFQRVLGTGFNLWSWDLKMYLY